MSTDFGIAKIVDNRVQKKDKQTARFLRKLLKGMSSVSVTLTTGSVYTMVEAVSKTGERFMGYKDGKPGRFHIGMVKNIEVMPKARRVDNDQRV